VSSLRLLSATRHGVDTNHSTSSPIKFFATSRLDKELPFIDLSMRDWMLANEPFYLPDPHYMGHKQRHLTPKMRFILLSWLTEVINLSSLSAVLFPQKKRQSEVKI
jgi:hypothetical protein